jgi:hypothetical protein
MPTIPTMTDDYTPISASVSADDIAKTWQPVRQQTDGLGLRAGNKAEFTLIAPVKPGALRFLESAWSRGR